MQKPLDDSMKMVQLLGHTAKRSGTLPAHKIMHGQMRWKTLRKGKRNFH